MDRTMRPFLEVVVTAIETVLSVSDIVAVVEQISLIHERPSFLIVSSFALLPSYDSHPIVAYVFHSWIV
ncbi:unnamed protein product [Wuchereria bancrofti]|uniref:Uncharacterized protein n=1 Tax=Wuchereria bancrofti TaxID=6293 RepID=A0A3P7GAI7_WUCBA|nr:unnamed protein product [Wuchereria bancrofti]